MIIRCELSSHPRLHALRQRPHLYFLKSTAAARPRASARYVCGHLVCSGKEKSALFAHVSQDGQGIWRQHHEVIANWRGRELEFRAEALSTSIVTA